MDAVTGLDVIVHCVNVPRMIGSPAGSDHGQKSGDS